MIFVDGGAGVRFRIALCLAGWYVWTLGLIAHWQWMPSNHAHIVVMVLSDLSFGKEAYWSFKFFNIFRIDITASMFTSLFSALFRSHVHVSIVLFKFSFRPRNGASRWTNFLVCWKCLGPYTNHVAFFRPLFDPPPPRDISWFFEGPPLPPKCHVFFVNFLEYYCTQITVTESSWKMCLLRNLYFFCKTKAQF